MKMESAVQQVLTSAEHILPADLSKKIASMSAELERCSGLTAIRPLGVEETAKRKIVDYTADLDRRRTQFQRQLALCEEFPVISMEPLTWRGEDGLPSLVVFNVDSTMFEIEVFLHQFWEEFIIESIRDLEARFVPQRCLVERRVGSKTSIKFVRRSLPEPIATCYADVLKKLKNDAKKRNKLLKMMSRFEGVIPPEIRQRITETRELFDDIFLLAEPTGFTIYEEEIPKIIPRRYNLYSKDPLVVGYHSDTPKRLWLIASFDMTSVEELIASQALTPFRRREK